MYKFLNWLQISMENLVIVTPGKVITLTWADMRKTIEVYRQNQEI